MTLSTKPEGEAPKDLPTGQATGTIEGSGSNSSHHSISG